MRPSFGGLAALLVTAAMAVLLGDKTARADSVDTGSVSNIQFKKVVLDTRFVSEGIAVADVNKDGRLDIMAGSAWYEAPDWTVHEIAPFQKIDIQRAWSTSFHNWAADLNGDGWTDQIVIGMPGQKAIWRENPKGESGHWKAHPIWRSACNESPLYVDLLGDGKKVLVMGYDDSKMAWFEPAEDPYAEWICHDVSEPGGAGSQRFSHGLGVGDLTGDDKNEILTKDGYYVRPEGDGIWGYIETDLGMDCAHMLAHEGTVLSTSAHARGVWQHAPVDDRFETRIIDETISVTHSACLTELNGRTNLITGKRKWGHPPGVDVGSEEPHWVVRYELVETAAGPKWERHMIDEDSGVGTQFEVADVNGDELLDIVTANKSGVFLFVQSAR
jgi:hypothetical protein